VSEFVSFIQRSNWVRRSGFLAFCWALFFFHPRVVAQESRSNELRLISEPIGYTDVIDAFDKDDPFDLNFGFGYQITEKSGTIWREERVAASSDAVHHDIAKHTHSLHQLNFGLEVGLYRDLMFYTRMPVVISDTREIEPIHSEDQTRQVTADSEGSETDAVDVVLFELPFASATRSGIPEIDFGLAWGITNQFRTPHLPTWVVRLESRFSVGEVLKPSCREVTAGLECDRSPGLSSGYHALRFESRTSYRYRYLEPYLGLALQFQWVGLAGYYFLPRLEDGARVSSEDVVNSRPPDEWETALGIAFVPWEAPADYQRFVIDLQLNAIYVTSGRDRSPLFDVLGTSTADALVSTQSELVDPDSKGRAGDAPFYGLTDVQSHARLNLRMALIMQAARYLRLMLGIGFGFETDHLLTATDKCVVDDDADSDNADPRCPDGGVLNRNYRDVIDRAGQRFGLGGNLTVDAFVHALGTF
jgi:hypothetical protein